jgi:uncharacterized protein YjbJ (UPF0337 family)
MNKDTVAGKAEQMKGQIKQKVGEVLGNERLSNSGVADEVKGAARETWGKTQDAARDVVSSKEDQARMSADDAKARMGAKADEIGSKIATTAQNVKDSLSEKIDDFRRSHDDV